MILGLFLMAFGLVWFVCWWTGRLVVFGVFKTRRPGGETPRAVELATVGLVTIVVAGAGLACAIAVGQRMVELLAPR